MKTVCDSLGHSTLVQSSIAVSASSKLIFSGPGEMSESVPREYVSCGRLVFHWLILSTRFARAMILPFHLRHYFAVSPAATKQSPFHKHVHGGASPE